MIEIRELLKTYRRGGETVVACDVAELTLESGEQVALMGSSGSGKSTLLHILSGLLLPDSGTVKVGDVEVTGQSEHDRDRFRATRIGYIFQTFNLLPGFSALENVRLGAFFAGRKHDKGVAEGLLDRVGMADRRGHYPRELSVGQQQRVAVARALINKPELLLADEPLGNQDPETGGKALDLMLEIAREMESTVIMVTHDPLSAAHMQRRIDLHDLAAAANAPTGSSTGGQA
jgi:ABC-type lipoprotein export system ATPase subunit